MRFSQKFNGTTPSAGAPPAAVRDDTEVAEKGRRSPSQMFEVPVTAGPKSRSFLMANHPGEINDRERRKALIAKLATRIRLDRMQLQLDELRETAQ
jgi:hypothetical protein